MDFKLDAIDTSAATEGVDIPLKRLDGTPLLNAVGDPVSLRLIGADSPEYRRLSRKFARNRIERSKKAKGDAVFSDPVLDEIEKEDFELVVACTKGWTGVIDSKDKPVPFSEEAALAFYRMFPVAFEQANTAIVDRANFIKASSTT
jgi:hypothetical protein